MAKKNKVVVWRLDPDLADAYRKIIGTATKLVGAKGGRGTAALTRALVAAVAEGREAASKSDPGTDYPA